MRLQPGEVFAGYKVVRQLGRGGMAYVYLGEEAAAGRMVALKLLMEDLLEEPQFQARFEHEAKTIASLEHPAIVPMYRYGVERDVAWMALRYVEGGDLSARLKRTLAIPEGLRVFRQIADAIDFAHRRGVIHRDIKPQNVLMSQDGHVYLADFGIAKVLSGAGKLRTATGMVLGSPQYMSPECARGDPPGQAADIYALGVMAFQWLTGDVPFDADTPQAVLFKQAKDPLPEAPLSNLAAPVAQVLRQVMDKDPAQRHASASSFIDQLATALALPEPVVIAEKAPAHQTMPRQVAAPIDPETYVTSPQLAISTDQEETPATPASNNTEPAATQTEASDLEDWRPAVTATPPPVARSKLKAALIVSGTVVGTAALVSYLAPPELFKWPKAPPAPTPIPAITLAPGTALPEPGIPFRHPLKSGGLGPEMVVVPPGQFQMGSPPTEVDWSLDEGPIRQVTIARFAIGVTEITLADWQLCVKQGQCPDVQHEPNATVDIDDAIQTVSWQDAQRYVTWLNSETGANYRLPSESEFEYAARAGTDTAYWWGNRMGWDWANCYECSNKFGPAKTFPRNNWALYGTAGYPWEWVQDCYVGDYADAPKDGTARELDECTKRTLRGVGRSADRYSNDAASRELNGFRVAQSLN